MNFHFFLYHHVLIVLLLQKRSIDTYEAERIEGFVSWVSRKDVPGTNQMAASGIPDVFDFAFAEYVFLSLLFFLNY